MAVVAVPSAIASLSLAEAHSALASVAGGIAVLTALAAHAVVLWKMDWNYRRPEAREPR